MANPEHLEILKQGVETWNRWRRDNPYLQLDLSEADLSRAILINANLTDATLYGAKLIDANLSDAKLIAAKLNVAILDEANLSGANLSRVNLIDSNLNGANLTEAHLWETQRSGWSIKDVICESAYWDRRGREKTPYRLGEFERLFADKTRIRLFYKDGINPLEAASLPGLIKHLEESHPGCSLRLVAIHDDAGGAIVELAIEDPGDRSSEQRKQLEAEAQ